MTAQKLVKARPKVVLEPINLHNADEFQELLGQRVICGWNKEATDLEKWRAASDLGQKSMFWIHLPPSADANDDDDDVQGQRRIGHISFQSVPDVGGPNADPELAKPDKTVLMISSFFLLHEHRRGGVGTAAMRQLEAMTQVAPYGSPKCHTLTLHTVSNRHVDVDDDGSPDGWLSSRGVWEKVGMPGRAKGSGLESWYVRMGYTKWKEERRYHEQLPDGTKFQFLAAFLRKDVSGARSSPIEI